MRRIILAVLVALTVLSCSKSNTAKITGNIDGATGNVVLKVLEVSAQKTVDTLKLKTGGVFSHSVKLGSSNPSFYYLYYNNKQIASMVLLPGDKIKISADTTGAAPVILGSQETEKLNELEKSLSSTKQNFDLLLKQMLSAKEQGNSQKETALNYDLGKIYVKQKRDAINHIYANPNSITNIILLYYKLSAQIPLFSDPMDALIFRRVYDSLNVMYPGWVYLDRLMEEINYREKSNLLSSKIFDASESGFPDISLPDIKAVTRSLSELSSKVILLSFWTVTETSQKMINLNYKDLYEKYNSKGLEIYQVSIDIDKTAWATVVSDQKLPWISVCDGLGRNSMTLSTYNIKKVPANFIIDKSGTIIAKDVYNSDLEKLIVSLLK